VADEPGTSAPVGRGVADEPGTSAPVGRGAADEPGEPGASDPLASRS